MHTALRNTVHLQRQLRIGIDNRGSSGASDRNVSSRCDAAYVSGERVEDAIYFLERPRTQDVQLTEPTFANTC